jgi:hypothetical protein
MRNSDRPSAVSALPSFRLAAAIVDGTAPADLTATGLAKALPIPGASRSEGSDVT